MVGLGILVALAASVANAFAVVLQAAEDRQSPLEEGAHASLLVRLAHRPRWLAGTGLMVVAWPLQILALTLAPITIVQPTLSATQLVLLAVARVRLREHVGWIEFGGALAIVAGIGLVIYFAPRHTAQSANTARLIEALAVVGGGALLAYALGRRRPRAPLFLVIGAGLAYAWVDFVNKLLANDISRARWAAAVAWLVATIGFGALAFLQETTALQRRPAVTVSPVVGAVQDPLPVLMALWAGVETWAAGSRHLAGLACGLTIVTAGAALLGRSKAVARVAGDEPVATGSRPRLACCAPGRRERAAVTRPEPASPACAAGSAETGGAP